VSSKIGYWRGCVTRERKPELAQAITSLLSKAGVNYVVLDERACCGAPAIVVSGSVELFKNFKHKVVDLINRAGVDLVISGCPTCTRVFKEWYSNDLPNVKFMHATELFHDFLSSGKLKIKRKLEGFVTYHDPCDLGRGLGVYETPRKIVEATGLKIVELKNSRNLCRCCGGGGGVWFAYPPLSTEISRLKLEEAMETGADTLLSACATCEYRISSTALAEDLPIKCRDVLEVLDEVT